MTTPYCPESYESPCRRDPWPFDLAIDRDNLAAIQACRDLCRSCHPDHARKCLKDNVLAAGVVAGLTLTERTRLRKTGHPIIPAKYHGDLRRRPA